MDSGKVLERIKARGAVSKGHLHSPAHVLADELCKKLSDPKHFGAYLRICLKHDHTKIRLVLGQVLENQNAQSPARLFMFLMKNNK